MKSAYSPTARMFHWAVALAVIIQYISVLLLPERSQDPTAIINFHMSFGVLILVLMLARLIWRIYAKAPPQDASLPTWQATLSSLTHMALYALLVAMPIVGWLWASALGWPVTLFGIIPLPALTAASTSFAHTVGPLHELVSLGIILIVGLHVVAALYHWLIVKDGIMQRMWP